MAEAGARVALVEKRSKPDAYKVTCTHAILPAGAATIERLGLAPLLYEHGALRTGSEVWTPHGGWVTVPHDEQLGWGVTRQTFDPLIRDLAINTPGVEFLPGWTAKQVLGTGPALLDVENRNRRRRVISTTLLVGADGRESSLARLAGVPGRVLPHNRCFYFAYWRGVQPKTGSIRVWLIDPIGGGAQFPNEDGLTMLVTGFRRAQIPQVRADPEGWYLRRLGELPDGPDLREAERVSKVMGKLEMPNVIRLRSRPGMAFVGDAAVACDPVFGVGISFALLSGEWLADITADALGSGRNLEGALASYRRQVLGRLGPHYLQMASYSSGRAFNPAERLFLRRAAVDPVVRRGFGQFLVRQRGPLALANPRLLSRLLKPRPDSTGQRPVPADLKSPQPELATEPTPDRRVKEAA
jgi:flavin-dependent dehydrogenase